MSKDARSRLLGLLRVPPEPRVPPGDGDSVVVFRAARNYFRYHFARWAIGQLGALTGLLVGVVLLRTLPDVFGGYRGLVLMVEVVAWIGFLLQLPVTYALLRLDYEQRWYIVTDRSIRIRAGIATVREQTMTLANVQNMSIRQGPLQRLLGIADLEVHAAGGRGGSGADAKQDGKATGMHVGTFRGVDNATEIRDLIRGSVRRFRDAGLGDPDDARGAVDSAKGLDQAAPPSAELAAAEVLAEVRALRMQMR